MDSPNDLTAAPEISVLIPAFNEAALIGGVLDRVHASFSSAGHRSYEIVVCDNNSTDDTAALAAAKGAKVVFEPHNQIARARNTAAGIARGQWLIFLDADTFLTREILTATIACLGRGDVVGGGSVLKFDLEKIGFGPAAMTWLWNAISIRFRLAAGSYLFCTREAWKAVGGFDEDFYAAEEIVFSRRIKRWGRKRRLRFVMLTEAPIVTSARKMEWYSQWQLMIRVLLLAFPGALKRRERCGLWYQRPKVH